MQLAKRSVNRIAEQITQDIYVAIRVVWWVIVNTCQIIKFTNFDYDFMFGCIDFVVSSFQWPRPSCSWTKSSLGQSHNIVKIGYKQNRKRNTQCYQSKSGMEKMWSLRSMGKMHWNSCQSKCFAMLHIFYINNFGSIGSKLRCVRKWKLVRQKLFRCWHPPSFCVYVFVCVQAAFGWLIKWKTTNYPKYTVLNATRNKHKWAKKYRGNKLSIFLNGSTRFSLSSSLLFLLLGKRSGPIDAIYLDGQLYIELKYKILSIIVELFLEVLTKLVPF